MILLTKREARSLTDEVKADAQTLWTKLLRLYEGEGHTALGYSSWGAYFEAEFGQSSKQGYRLLEAARVQEITGPLSHGTMITERQARELVPLLNEPEEMAEVFQDIVGQHGAKGATAEIIKQAVEQSRGQRSKPKTIDYDKPAEYCEMCHQKLPRSPDERRPDPANIYPDPDGWYRAHWTNRVDKFGDRIPAATPADLSHALWTLNANRNVYTATFYYTPDSRPRNVQQIVTNPNYVSRAPAAAGWRTGRNFHDRPSGWEQPPKVQRAYKKWAATPLGLRRDGAGAWEVPEEYDNTIGGKRQRLTWEADPMPHEERDEDFGLNPKTRPKGYRPDRVSPIDTSERDRVFAESDAMRAARAAAVVADPEPSTDESANAMGRMNQSPVEPMQQMKKATAKVRAKKHARRTKRATA